MKRAKKVLVFGTFDLLHPGHLAFLSAAARHGEVTVVITPDVKVKKEKGRAAHFSERERIQMVSALKQIGKAVIGDKGKKWTVVKRLMPDIICVGHDQNAEHPNFLAQLANLTKRPKIIRVSSHEPARYSSSKVKLEIHRSGQKKNRR